MYVDFSLLIDLKADGPQGFVWEQGRPGEAPKLVPAKSKKEITSIGQWSQAWDIYMSVYSRRYPDQTHNLVTYASKVKDLAAKGGDFIKYDKGFRKARARFMSLWEIPDLELWLECSQAGIRRDVNRVLSTIRNVDTTFPQPATSSQATSQGGPSKLSFPFRPNLHHPHGSCYAFHNSGKCDRPDCKFSHICWTQGCGQPHSVFQCPRFQSPTPQAASGAPKPSQARV